LLGFIPPASRRRTKSTNQKQKNSKQ
jgi:hypothetical protein